MTSLHCPICGKNNPYKVRYQEKFNTDDLEFVARKTPDHMHFRIVECEDCRMIYSNPIIPESEIIQLYRKSRFIAEPQLNNMLNDYVDQFSRVQHLANSGRLLDIGCANGFFMQAAKEKFGYEVYGIEPGAEACQQASEDIRENIINDELKSGLFSENYFNVITFFQVFDHIIKPNEFLQQVNLSDASIRMSVENMVCVAIKE